MALPRGALGLRPFDRLPFENVRLSDHTAPDRGCVLSDNFAPGDRLGRYELVKIIGGGGFASVWRARTAGPGGFERSVAVKVIRPARARLKRFQDMLLDEARLVARIQHPNVTQIWEVGEDPRSIYVVMELVEGASLDELRERAEDAGKSLPLGAVFRVLADVCGGLHVAHELGSAGPGSESLGLVHRDVSPQNILVSRHGVAKLIDFGIAKAKERLVGDTTTGFIKGKVSFMAPEQARAEGIDRRADIWAIGAVAHEMIEGRPPMKGETDLARLASLVSPDPVPELAARVPAPLRAVVARALEKDPSRRYPTAAEMKEALEEAMIESELETSSDDVAILLRRYFEDAEPSPDAAHSVEHGVSSTIEGPARGGDAAASARHPSATIELPMRRRPPWVLPALLVVVGAPALWWAVRAPSVDPDLGGGSEGASSAPPVIPAPPSAPSPNPAALPSAVLPGAAPASVSAAPSATGRPSASAAVAPRVQRKPASTAPSARPAPTVDEDAIE